MGDSEAAETYNVIGNINEWQVTIGGLPMAVVRRWWILPVSWTTVHSSM